MRVRPHFIKGSGIVIYISTFSTPNIHESMNVSGLGEAGGATHHLPPTVYAIPESVMVGMEGLRTIYSAQP